jgi:alanine racemase
MQEPHAEDLANHSDRESCECNRSCKRSVDSGMHRLGIEPRK